MGTSSRLIVSCTTGSARIDGGGTLFSVVARPHTETGAGIVIEKPRVFQTAGEVGYTVILAASVAWWTTVAIWAPAWFGGDSGRTNSVFLVCLTLGAAGFWCAMLRNRRRSWTQKSPIMRYTVAEFEALDPETQAQLGVADEEFHARWMRRRARRQRWNPVRLIRQH